MMNQLKNSLLKPNERLDDLEFDNLKIIQDKNGYKFSTDSVLLANFGKAKQNDVYVDLCSGSAVVAILFSCKNKIKKTYAVEIQPRLADMAKRSVELNGLTDKISVINMDLSEAYKILGCESVDVITINPPYFDSGKCSENDEIKIATHEVMTNISKIAQSACKLLKYGGKIYLVHRADRLSSVIFELVKNNLEPKVLRVVYPKLTKEPNLVLIEAKKGAKAGLKIMQPLILNNADGSETEELRQIYSRKN